VDCGSHVGLLPRSDKEISELGGDVIMDCIEVLGIMQGACIRLGFTSELVGDCGNDTSPFPRFFELSRAEKGATQDGLWCVATFPETFGYCIRNRGFARARLTSQPEYTRAL
jgi:hypothetical protein